jgi:hypothetical protein
MPVSGEEIHAKTGDSSDSDAPGKRELEKQAIDKCSKLARSWRRSRDGSPLNIPVRINIG